MDTVKTYDKFPVWIVIIANLVSILIYASGVFVTMQLGLVAAALYIIFILSLEYRLIYRHCVDCYYWGGRCGFGKGSISSLFFKRGDPSKFCDREMSWKDMIPDLMVLLIPLVIAIVLLIRDFNFILLAVTVLMIALATAGNNLIRGSLTCKYCKQRELGCPAERLFSKTTDS